MPAQKILSTLSLTAIVLSGLTFATCAPAFAAGEETDATTPPVATETTTVCTDGKIFNTEKKECQDPAAVTTTTTTEIPATTTETPATTTETPATATETPATTETAPECPTGKVVDAATKACIDPPKSGFNDDQLYKAAREFAYAGQYGNAIRALELAANQNDPRILNYLGYANRKAGRMEIGMEYYRRAIAVDANYILARSYMGQALIQQGDVDAAKVELVEIRDRGGENTWAYRSLLQSLNGYGTY